MEYNRILDLKELLKKKSHFLFGPRATGKSTLIRKQLKDACYINLLDSEIYYRLVEDPGLFRSMLPRDPSRWIVIDEVQRVPELLNQTHKLIEEEKRRFLLTGSSARSLKRGHANLLAGRAWRADLFPLVSAEIGKDFNLAKVLQYGTLPAVFTSDFPQEELKAYTHTYLYEEIQAESVVRKIPQFTRFLQSAALNFAELLNFTNISNDSGVAASTLKEHYKILEDTLIGFQLIPWLKGKSRKAIQTSKFYFFDNGVCHTLAKTQSLDPNASLWGKSFEQFLINEVKAYLSYSRKDLSLSYWRSKNGSEVDLLIEDQIAIEFKSTKKITPKHLSGLEAIQSEGKFKSFILVSTDPIIQNHGKIECLPYLTFLNRLWAGDLV